MGTLLLIVTILSCDFDKYLHLKHSEIQMCRGVGIFQKSHNPIVMTLLAPGEECHKSCVNLTSVTIDPPNVNIISILLYKK